MKLSSNKRKPLFSGSWIKNSERFQDDKVLRINFVLSNNDDFYIPFSRLVTVDKQPHIPFPKILNSFPANELKFVRNKLQFSSELKMHFLNKTPRLQPPDVPGLQSFSCLNICIDIFYFI